MMIYQQLARAFFPVGLIIILSACGGGGSNSPPPAPSATTFEANPISNDNAVLNGDVNPNGLETSAWFEYGQDNNPSTFAKTDNQAIGSGTASLPIQAAIDNLTAGTTYNYRVVASNSAGTSFGAIDGFTTELLPPVVSTSPANPISNDNAVLNGDVNPKGLPTSAWFEWGTDPVLNGWAVTSSDNVGAGSASVAIQTPLANLTPGTTYYFRVAAQNTEGTSKGAIESFKPSQIPSATTNAATFTSRSATLNGSVNPNGLETNYWFVWGTDPNLPDPGSTFEETLPKAIAAGTFAAQPVDAPLSGLNPSTTYYFGVVASNAEGEAQGAIRNFTTSLSPTVTTNPATFNSPTSAVLKGDANPNGYATTAWFEYGTDPSMNSFSITSPPAQLGSGSTAVPFNATIPVGLYQTYYFRAVANSIEGGVEKGAIRTFQTGVRYVAVGDSITEGSHDTILSDGIGYEPILGNLRLNNPYTVANKGVPGHTSADGAASIAGTLSTYPSPSAKDYLIMYGTNDAFIPAVPSGMALNPGNPGYNGSYKDNMQRIISAIIAAKKTPYLAKVPFTTTIWNGTISNSSIQEYNTVIDELRVKNGITVTAPPFYSYFQAHQGELDDGLHPNGVGYQSMAALWFNVLP